MFVRDTRNLDEHTISKDHFVTTNYSLSLEVYVSLWKLTVTNEATLHSILLNDTLKNKNDKNKKIDKIKGETEN